MWRVPQLARRLWRLLLPLVSWSPSAPPSPPALPESPFLFELTLTRFYDGALFGFVLEPTAHGALIAELSSGLPADLDDTLLQGDVILGAEGRERGLFDEAALHECRLLDHVPEGAALTEVVWQPRGLHTAYRSVRLIVQRTPPRDVAEAGALIQGDIGDWQPAQLRLRQQYGAHDLYVAGARSGTVYGRQVIHSRLERRGTLVQLTVVTAAHRLPGTGLPVGRQEVAAFVRRNATARQLLGALGAVARAAGLTTDDAEASEAAWATLSGAAPPEAEPDGAEARGAASRSEAEALAARRSELRARVEAQLDELAAEEWAHEAPIGPGLVQSLDEELGAAAPPGTCTDDPAFFDQDGDDCRAYVLNPASCGVTGYQAACWACCASCARARGCSTLRRMPRRAHETLVVRSEQAGALREVHTRLLQHAVPRLRPTADGQVESLILQSEQLIGRTWHITVGKMREVEARDMQHAASRPGQPPLAAAPNASKPPAGPPPPAVPLAAEAGAEGVAAAQEEAPAGVGADVGASASGEGVCEAAGAGEGEGEAAAGNASRWWVLANEHLLAYDAPGAHGLGEAQRVRRVVSWRVEYRPEAHGGPEGLLFLVEDELGETLALRPEAPNASWLWLAAFSRLPSHQTHSANLLEAGAGWAVLQLLCAQPLHLLLQLGALLAPLATLLGAWLASSVLLLAALAWVATAWGWASMVELAFGAMLDLDLALLTVQLVLALSTLLELGLACCRAADGRRPAILDTLHDRLLRESGTVLALLTVGCLFTSDGLAEMFSWHMQWQLAMACLREFRRTRDGLRAWGARPARPRGTRLRRACGWCARAAWRCARRALSLLAFVGLLLSLRLASLLLWGAIGYLVRALEAALGWLEAAALAAVEAAARLPGPLGALVERHLLPGGRLFGLHGAAHGGALLGSLLLVHNAYRVAQYLAQYLGAYVAERLLAPGRRRRPLLEHAWCAAFVLGVCALYFLLLEPRGAARARLRELMMVVELTLPWFEVDALTRLRRQTAELARRVVRRVSRRAVAPRVPEMGDTCAICCEPLIECRLRLGTRLCAPALPRPIPPALVATPPPSDRPSPMVAAAHAPLPPDHPARLLLAASAARRRAAAENPDEVAKAEAEAARLTAAADAASAARAPAGARAPPACVRAAVTLHAPALDYCRWGCGRAVHLECSEEWRAHRNECVFCGSFWS